MQTNFQQGIEFNLGNLLKPIDPDPEFLQHLNQRLANPAEISVERQHNSQMALLVLFGGLAGGVFVIWLLRKLWEGSRA